MSGQYNDKLINSKSIAFIGIMSALGTLLALLSLYLVPIVGNQVALDLSHIGTYIVALGGGPILGLVTGAIVGFLPSYRFANIAIVPGKMMTGFFVGIIYGLFQKLKKVDEKKTLQTLSLIIAGLVGYIPECIFTWIDMTYIVGLDFVSIVLPTLIKAWIEITVITLMMSVIFNIPYIKNQIEQLVGNKINLSVYDYLLSAIITIPIFSVSLYVAAMNNIIIDMFWNFKPDVFATILWVSMGVEVALIGIMIGYYIYSSKISK